MCSNNVRHFIKAKSQSKFPVCNDVEDVPSEYIKKDPCNVTIEGFTIFLVGLQASMPLCHRERRIGKHLDRSN